MLYFAVLLRWCGNLNSDAVYLIFKAHGIVLPIVSPIFEYDRVVENILTGLWIFDEIFRGQWRPERLKRRDFYLHRLRN